MIKVTTRLVSQVTKSFNLLIVFAGNFSFGSFTRFKSPTVVEFIENAVEHSRSGRYLFFLHRRPVRNTIVKKYKCKL